MFSMYLTRHRHDNLKTTFLNDSSKRQSNPFFTEGVLMVIIPKVSNTNSNLNISGHSFGHSLYKLLDFGNKNRFKFGDVLRNNTVHGIFTRCQQINLLLAFHCFLNRIPQIPVY